MTVGLTHYLVLSAFVFACGLLTMLLKRNAVGILMGVELVLNAATINLVSINRYWHSTAGNSQHALHGQIFALFIIVIAAAEAAVALAIFLNFYNNFSSVDVEKAKMLKETPER